MRAQAIWSLAAAINTGELAFELCDSTESTMEKLTKIPGIGDWTATYIAMCALGDTDAFPETDLGIHKALGDKKPKEMRELSEQWKPWRNYATMTLWDSLNTEDEEAIAALSSLKGIGVWTAEMIFAVLPCPGRMYSALMTLPFSADCECYTTTAKSTERSLKCTAADFRPIAARQACIYGRFPAARLLE